MKVKNEEKGGYKTQIEDNKAQKQLAPQVSKSALV